jgi:hypothetical protein
MKNDFITFLHFLKTKFILLDFIMILIFFGTFQWDVYYPNRISALLTLFLIALLDVTIFSKLHKPNG